MANKKNKNVPVKPENIQTLPTMPEAINLEQQPVNISLDEARRLIAEHEAQQAQIELDNTNAFKAHIINGSKQFNCSMGVRMTKEKALELMKVFLSNPNIEVFTLNVEIWYDKPAVIQPEAK